MTDRLAFIDHSFHQTSVATSFLVDLLRKRYQVDHFWDESWQGGPPVDLDALAAGGYAAIVLFQAIKHYPAKRLKRCNCKNIVLVPMYDNSGGWPDLFWWQYRHCKIINFSSTLHARMAALGLNTRHFRFFLPPEPEAGSRRGEPERLRGFLWQRTNQVTWPLVRSLVDGWGFNSFHLHLAVDPPGFDRRLPTTEEAKRYSITVSDWFNGRDEYLAALSDADVFFAPRWYEGIGMSFLEALARGMVVVAPDCPTMSEYIRHAVNGLLYNPWRPTPIARPPLAAIREKARQLAVEGYAEWDQAKEKLLDFIAEEPRPMKVRFLHLGLAGWLFAFAAPLWRKIGQRRFRLGGMRKWRGADQLNRSAAPPRRSPESKKSEASGRARELP